MTPATDLLSREERAALRRLRELLKEQQRARSETRVPPAPTPSRSEDRPTA